MGQVFSVQVSQELYSCVQGSCLLQKFPEKCTDTVNNSYSSFSFKSESRYNFPYRFEMYWTHPLPMKILGMFWCYFFFFFIKSQPKFPILLYSYYQPLLFLLSHSFSGKRRMGRTSVTLPEQVISGHACSPGGHRKQVAVLIVLAPNSCPSWRQFRSGQEVSGLLCPPRFATSCIHNNLRYVPGKGN